MIKKLNEFLESFGHFFHPILFALFPLLSFYGANASEIQSGDFKIATFVFFNLLVLVVAWALSLLVTRDLKQASILTFVFLVIFFMFGRLDGLVEGFSLKTPVTLIGPSKLMIILSLVLLIVAYFGIKKIKDTSKVNYWLTIIAGALVLSTLISVIPAVISNEGSKSTTTNNTSAEGALNADQLPDIYYILLDGYAREDILKENFNYDNSPFTNSLREKGFFVADKARSNYAHTHLSVPSTFNMKYLDYLTEEVGAESVDRKPLKDLTQKNEVVPIFKNLGYKYVHIGSQWGWTMNSDYNDIDVKTKENTESKIVGIELDEFALVYLQTTALKPWISNSIRGTLLSRVLGSFEKTEAAIDLDEPTLTFSHILSPHPPYLFDRNGIVQGHTELELLNEGFSDREKFADQTDYVNKLILDLVTKMQAKEKPPIIIVASDHGPASSLTKDEFAETDITKLDLPGVKERLSILNAYYFPDRNYSQLTLESTPVNSFRIILNQYFGREDLVKLPENSFFSSNSEAEYRFIDVTEVTR